MRIVISVTLFLLVICGFVAKVRAEQTNLARSPKTTSINLQQGDFDTVDVQLPTGWEVVSVTSTATGGLVVWSKPLFTQETATCRTWVSLVYVVETSGNKLFMLHGKDAACATEKTVTTTVIH